MISYLEKTITEVDIEKFQEKVKSKISPDIIFTLLQKEYSNVYSSTNLSQAKSDEISLTNDALKNFVTVIQELVKLNPSFAILILIAQLMLTKTFEDASTIRQKYTYHERYNLANKWKTVISCPMRWYVLNCLIQSLLGNFWLQEHTLLNIIELRCLLNSARWEVDKRELNKIILNLKNKWYL